MKTIKLGLLGALFSVFLFSSNVRAVPVDIAFVVDQSVSMGPEWAWLPGVLNSIDIALASESVVTSVRYGIAGYMEGAGNEFLSSPPAPNSSEYVGLAYNDFTSDISVLTAAAIAAAGDLRASTERGYHAADWARTGFSWANDAVKVIVLLTDENADQGSVIDSTPGLGSDEANLGFILDQGDFLLNVITQTSRFSQWDEAVYDQNSTYQGLFDLNFLRDNPDDFTQQFVAAKVGEIVGEACDPQTDPNQCVSVPTPGTLILFAMGLVGMGCSRRLKAR